jgi:hypothetical protein
LDNFENCRLCSKSAFAQVGQSKPLKCNITGTTTGLTKKPA